MQVLVGTDTQSIDEVAASCEQFGDRYTTRLFTDREIARCGGASNPSPERLAEHFAAKEAVLKILGDDGDVAPWTSIEVCAMGDVAGDLVLHGLAQQLAQRRGVRRCSLSTSRNGREASAVVVAYLDQRESGVTP